MTSNNTFKPDRCRVCGRYLATNRDSPSDYCFDPGHWQAAGKLATDDFYEMARITAEAYALKINRRCETRNDCKNQPTQVLTVEVTPTQFTFQKLINWLKSRILLIFRPPTLRPVHL